MLDTVPTEAISTAEVLTQSELQRQEAEALKNMLRAKARRERAETEAFIRATLAHPDGMRAEAAALAARCTVALKTAAKAYRARLSDTEYEEARAGILAAAVKTAAERDTMPLASDYRGRREAVWHPGRPAAHRLALAPYGTAEAEARIDRLAREALTAEAGGFLPRADRCHLAYLEGIARNVIGDLLGHRDRHSWSDVPDEAEGRWNADDLTADSWPDLTGREALAVGAALGESLTELGAEQGKTAKGAERAAAKGREALRAKYETARAMVLAARPEAEQEGLKSLLALPRHLAPVGPGRPADVLAWIDRAEALPSRYLTAAEASRAARLAAEAERTCQARPDRTDEADPYQRWPLQRAAIGAAIYRAKRAAESAPEPSRGRLEAAALPSMTEAAKTEQGRREAAHRRVLALAAAEQDEPRAAALTAAAERCLTAPDTDAAERIAASWQAIMRPTASGGMPPRSMGTAAATRRNWHPETITGPLAAAAERAERLREGRAKMRAEALQAGRLTVLPTPAP